jgi:uncharacterized membrane protein
MRSTIVAYLLTAVVFFGMDLVWLSTMVGFFYKPRIGDLLLDPPKLGVAAVFYLIYVVGVVVFAVLPAVKDGDWARAAWSGALLGFVAYGTYDMTNLATLRGFSASVAAIDMVWGTVATAVAATLAALGTSRWG